MKKTFFKNLFRNIEKTLSRFLSIVIITAVGAAFYSGVRAASPDMKQSAEAYFNKYNFMDFKLVSTLGITNDDIANLKDKENVKIAEGAYSLDAVTKLNGHSLVLNVLSQPQKGGINDLIIKEGRRAENNNEIVVEEKFLKKNKYKIGDKIKLETGNENNIQDSLKNNEFKIVGTAQSTLFISAQRQMSSVGSGTVNGFVYILPNVFKSEVYTEAYVKCNNNESKNSLTQNEDYKSFVGKEEKALKKFGEQRALVRYNDIVKTAQDSIKDKQKQIDMMKQTMGETPAVKAYETQLEEGREKLKEIKKPEWYVLGRSANVGYATYAQDSDRIDNIGKVFPLIFFLVAALVSLTTITRMVQQSRTEIGTFKALGYSSTAISMHYLLYALAASITGSIIGISIGFRLFPQIIMNAYGTLYSIPKSPLPFNIVLALEASIISVFFISISAVIAVLEELREVPAALIRPKAPKPGKTILLEKITIIWKRLKFSKKITARNIFRYKTRFFMTVIGIAACTGLIITGFGLKGAIVGALDEQFGRIYKYNMQGNLKDTVNDKEKQSIKDKILNQDNVKSVLLLYSKNGSVKTQKSSNEDTYVVIPENKSELSKYIDLSMNKKNLSLNDNGAVVTEKLAKLMNKKAGDTFELTIDGKVQRIKIEGITEQYIQHFVYISPEYYKKITGKSVEYNSFFGLLKSTSDSADDITLKELMKVNGINSISFNKNAKTDSNRNMQSMNTVIIVLIISAAVLAFIVIYNLTNININERMRELATIKLLGFYDNELAAYIYRENIILTIIGSIMGIFLGQVLEKFIMSTAETDSMMFLKTTKPIYFIYSVILTIIFSIIVNLIMYGKFGKIDMIESLKSAE